mgnify:CR=1 FL=1
MNTSFKEDYYRMTGTVYKAGVRSLAQWFISHQIRYVYWWRKANKSPNILNRMILKRYSKKYGLEISISAKIGRGLYLGHPYNITIGGGVQLGNNVNLHKGCTIGRENRGKREGVPTIGDNVAIGINATVIGNISIGSDVMIAPNSFVNFDVPDHSIVIGNPGVIHRKENATEGYIAFCVK